MSASAFFRILTKFAAAALAFTSFVAAQAQPRLGDVEIEAMLRRISLPPGFVISLYARAPGARTLAIGAKGKAIFIGTGDHRAYVMTPGDAHAAGVEPFMPATRLVMPHGVCLSKEGALFLVERNRVWRLDAAEDNWREADQKAVEIVKEGALIPRAEESDIHAARVCRVGPDGKLYIALGQPQNVAPREKLASYAATGVGGIIRMNQDGTDREVFATGVRNSVGMDFNSDGSLWFTDNQVDNMGDDTPPGEINRADRPGLNFGFPWYGGGHVRTFEYARETPPKDVVFPVVEEAAHAADLGLMFYRGAMFPPQYRGGIFSAQHGSWNRSVPIGARVMFTPLAANGVTSETKVFADGWNDGSDAYLGRPVDVAALADGSLLVTDDQNGAIYRIIYRAP